ncbi:hypothetical protein KW5_0114890 [Xanthomonas vasicola pv. vasculorum NCPPB 1326]|nr:hypothetical protein KW5_0114890 [Xanthomonas vasicola pv. vasculorum NCPPB 1326]KFA29738.1 hypothetical protein KWG_0114735 [Xanthomonas vasicola pv. vasculorum NCPPB 1381]
MLVGQLGHCRLYRYPLLLALHRTVADLFSFSFCGADEQLASAPLRANFIEPCMTDMPNSQYCSGVSGRHCA